MDFDNPSYFSMPNGQKQIDHSENLSSASESSLTKHFISAAEKHSHQDKRFFLRSVSSNSADSNQELLILGEPRINDIAPDLIMKHSPNRSNSLKTYRQKSSDMHCDLSYIPLPTSEEQADDLSGDEVFVSEDSARYYNFSSLKRNGQRRHSIGTFVGRERTSSVASSSKNFKEDFPQRENESINTDIDEHSLRHASYPRKRCARCTKVNQSKHINMDDILIVSLKSSDAASLWVDYFSNYFQQISKQANRKPFKIQYVGVDDILGKTEDDLKDLTEKSCGVKLQLVVVCPSFLDFISQHRDECSVLGKILLANRTLALLLGVTDEDLTPVHKNVLTNYLQWQRHGVGQDQDENFTKEFLGQAMAILSRVWKQQSSVVSQEKSCFSVTPKKIRQGQNSVFILLTYPLQKEDIVKISVERNGELFEMKSVKKRNPYIIKFTVPENLTDITAIVNVLVEKNGSIIGSKPIKCESKLRELGQILRSTNNPIEFMCQALGFNPAERENLDNWLVHGFQKSMPPHFNLLNNHDTPFVSAAIQTHKYVQEEFPTLLHFACKFGLEKLAMQLLDCPGADIAYEIRNVNELTPLEIAEASGYTELATMLKGYMNMNEITSMYAKLKEMSLNQKPNEMEDDGYLKPKIFQEFYKTCPPPRPLIPNSSGVTTPNCEWPSPLAGYTTMKTPVSINEELHNMSPTNSHFDFQPKTIHDTQSLCVKNIKSKNKPQVMEDKVQKELIEIINDFKNNVHSIAQVEKLVEEWKNRNDVQLSFKEKQDQLMQMRQKYEQIQSEMKTAMKKPTPFERIRKLFVKHKHEKCEITSPILCSAPSTTITPASRPISSLSTSSSGSSGRMSTISGCSVGDSGTHSDNEERKMILGSHSEDEFRSTLNKAVMEINYTPVPTPKPVKSPPVKHTFETIQEKPLTRPNTLPIAEEYYIQFPPSGLPVPGIESTPQNKDQTVSNDYMNISSNTSPGQSHEYMNIELPSMLR